mgnify:CR=1 FL=1
MARYAPSSPWKNTKKEKFYLGPLNIRPVPAEADDILYTIQPQYNYRPDLLAYDLYDDTKLWWVFAQRNMDVIKDPIFDFVSGTQIYLPKGDNLKRVLGN